MAQAKQGSTQPNILLLVDREGERALFRLVEIDDVSEVTRVVGDRQLPVVTVDVALPSPEQLGPTLRALPGQDRLVVVNLRTPSWRIQRQHEEAGEPSVRNLN
jgi:hypothetical protein